jgi:membrane protease YdiL (CAAX protease family)
MSDPVEPNAAGILVFLAISLLASFVTTAILINRLRHNESVLPYELRRRVPWEAADVLPFLVLWAMFFTPLATLANWAVSARRDNVAEKPSGKERHVDSDTEKPTEAEHPLITLIRERHDPQTLVVAALSAVVVAPIAEEFLFRLLLQGWLEAAENRLRRRLRFLRRLVRGVLPVAVVSGLFAVAHWRSGGTAEPDTIVQGLLLTSLLNLIIVGFAVAWLVRRGATLEDLGVVPGRFATDVRRGLIAFLAVGGTVYLLEYMAKLTLGDSPWADPIPLFFFALVLGTLYYRSHRLVSSVVLHMALNGASLAMAWLA